MSNKFGFTTAMSYLLQGKIVRRPEGLFGVEDGAIVNQYGDDLCVALTSAELIDEQWELVAE